MLGRLREKYQKVMMPIGRALARTFETYLTGGSPSNDVARRVADVYLGVVKRGVNVGDPSRDAGNLFLALLAVFDRLQDNFAQVIRENIV